VHSSQHAHLRLSYCRAGQIGVPPAKSAVDIAQAALPAHLPLGGDCRGKLCLIRGRLCGFGRPLRVLDVAMNPTTDISRHVPTLNFLLRAPCSTLRAQPKARRAFTIVELVIVVLVMGILMAAATPAFRDSLLFYRVESAARRLKSDLEQAQQAARLTGLTQSLTFTDKTYTLSSAVKGLDRHSQAYTVNLAAPPFALTTVTPNFGSPPVTFVTFNGYGMPSNGGTVVLRAQSNECTVSLDGVTGEVTITSNHTRGRTAAVN
jgi:prepilin-type N-terminal cleavage/methylation domain-containing protein